MDIRFEASDQEIRLRHLTLLWWRILDLYHDLPGGGAKDSEALEILTRAFEDASKRWWDGAGTEMINQDGLVGFFDLVTSLMGEHTPRAMRDAASELIRSLGHQKLHFDCGQCSRGIDGACKGTAGDAEYLSAEDGARCLGFLKDLVAISIRVAAEEYSALVSEDAETVIPRIRVANRIAVARTGTMPINASLEFVDDGSCGLLTIAWPQEPDDLSEAVLLLPYLIFHEICVHGAQMALCDQRTRVDPHCMFTEGAVDSVAYHVLRDRVLKRQQDLPEVLRPLRPRLEDATNRYFGRRNGGAPSARGGNGVIVSGAAALARDMERARKMGYLRIYEFLNEQMPDRDRGDRSLGHDVILSLNLRLDREQRRTFAQHALRLQDRLGGPPGPGSDRVAHRKAQDALLRRLRLFLKKGDHKRLLDGLEKLLAPNGLPSEKARQKVFRAGERKTR